MGGGGKGTGDQVRSSSLPGSPGVLEPYDKVRLPTQCPVRCEFELHLPSHTQRSDLSHRREGPAERIDLLCMSWGHAESVEMSVVFEFCESGLGRSSEFSDG